MGEYISSFGVTRTVGRGEGRDELYDASAKPALGAHNVIEVVVDEKGPAANKVDGTFGKDAACLPAGAVLVGGHIVKEGEVSMDGVSLSLVDKDGSNAVTILSSASGEVTALNGGLDTKYANAKYVKASGNSAAGLKAKVIIEYI